MPSPAEAVREMARVVAGRAASVVIVDFVQHDREWMKDKLGVLWQGFDTLETVHELVRPGRARLTIGDRGG